MYIYESAEDIYKCTFAHQNNQISCPIKQNTTSFTFSVFNHLSHIIHTFIWLWRPLVAIILKYSKPLKKGWICDHCNLWHFNFHAFWDGHQQVLTSAWNCDEPLTSTFQRSDSQLSWSLVLSLSDKPAQTGKKSIFFGHIEENL